MVQKRVRSGSVRWVGRYRDPAGRERSRTFDTKREAAAWESEREREMRRGEWLNPETENITVGEVFDRWAARPLRESSRKNYADTRANLGPWADYPARRLTRQDVDDWFRVLTTGRPWRGNRPLSQPVAREMVSRLRAAMLMAVRDDLVGKCVVVTPKAERVAVVPRSMIPDAQAVEDIARQVEEGGHPYTRRHKGKSSEYIAAAEPAVAGMIRTASMAGLRVSEMCGLRISDVDFLRREISVERQMTVKSGVTGPTKTRKGARVVPVPDELLHVLSGQAAGRDRDDWLFVKSSGSPWTKNSVTGVMTRVGKYLGVPFRMHSFRHYYATRIIAAGVPVSTVQVLLGHEHAATTLGTYTHFWPGDDEAVRVAAGRIAGSCGTSAGPGVVRGSSG